VLFFEEKKPLFSLFYLRRSTSLIEEKPSTLENRLDRFIVRLPTEIAGQPFS